MVEEWTATIICMGIFWLLFRPNNTRKGEQE